MRKKRLISAKHPSFFRRSQSKFSQFREKPTFSEKRSSENRSAFGKKPHFGETTTPKTAEIHTTVLFSVLDTRAKAPVVMAMGAKHQIRSDRDIPSREMHGKIWKRRWLVKASMTGSRGVDDGCFQTPSP
jgi:hypothetical protein